jgi:hypothetical protein
MWKMVSAMFLCKKNLLAREKQNLILAMRLAREKIAIIQAKMDTLDDTSEEYDQLQDEKNDHEMLVSDFEDRYEDLLNMPEV